MRQVKRGHYKEDEFQSIVHKAMKFIVKNRDISIIVGMAVVVGIGLVFYFLSAGEKQNPEADMMHTQVMGLINMGRLQEAENILLDLTSRFGDTTAGKVGLYYLGVICYHTGRFDESLSYFDKFLSSQKGHQLLVPSALFGAGCAAEGLKDYERALGYYKKVAKDKESPFYFIGMLAYGRTTGLVGDTEKAQEILKELIAENPPPDIAADARLYVGYFNE